MTAGDHTDIAHVDFALFGMWAIGRPGHNTAFGDCAYSRRGTALLPPEVAFGPACPVVSDPWISEASDRYPSGVTYTSTYLDDIPGIGGWYATTAQIERMGAVAYWVEY